MARSGMQWHVPQAASGFPATSRLRDEGNDVLRTIRSLRQRSTTPLSDPPSQPAPKRAPEIDLVVYAEDCVLSGHLPLAAERLSDLLNSLESFGLADVLVEDLAGSAPMEVPEVVVAREEILVVHAGGPRGNAARRQRTRQHAIVLKTGPYEVRGYIHTLPGSDPLASLRRRKPMVALTDAVIEFTVESAPQVRRAGVVIVNRDAVDWIVEGHEEEVSMPEMPVDSSGLLLKDFTGDVRDRAAAD